MGCSHKISTLDFLRRNLGYFFMLLQPLFIYIMLASLLQLLCLQHLYIYYSGKPSTITMLVSLLHTFSVVYTNYYGYSVLHTSASFQYVASISLTTSWCSSISSFTRTSLCGNIYLLSFLFCFIFLRAFRSYFKQTKFT